MMSSAGFTFSRKLAMLISTVLIFFSGSSMALGSGMGPYSARRGYLDPPAGIGQQTAHIHQHFNQRALALQTIDARLDEGADRRRQVRFETL